MAKPEIEIIRNAGIVGAGGAGFPSHVKFDTSVDTLIVNAAECEPMIHVDKQLLEKYFTKVFEGMKIAAGLVGAKRTVLALKTKYKDAIHVIEDFKNAGNSSGAEVSSGSGIGGSAGNSSSTASQAETGSRRVILDSSMRRGPIFRRSSASRSAACPPRRGHPLVTS